MERWLAFVLLLCLARADAFCPSVTVPRPGARSFASRPHPLLRECHDGALQLQLCKLAQRLYLASTRAPPLYREKTCRRKEETSAWVERA